MYRHNKEENLVSPASKFQKLVLGGLETLFYKYGKFVARNPVPIILLCVSLAGALTVPYFIMFKEEKEALELWIPRRASFYDNSKWLEENFPSTTRYNVIIFSTDDDTILTTEKIQKFFNIHHEVNNLVSKEGVTWKSVCLKWPNPFTKKPECAETSLLEVWATLGTYDNTNETIQAKTNEQILGDVNTVKRSGIFGFPLNLNLYLGSIDKENMTIRGARALQMTLQDDLKSHSARNPIESTQMSNSFEQEFMKVVEKFSMLNQDDSLKVHYFNLVSMKVSAGSAIDGDLQLLALGFIIVFAYVILMLGKFNTVEQRGFLSLMGLSAVMLGTYSSNGIAQLLGVFSTPMNSILTFMLLGIGIDDMFVVVQGLSNVQRDKELSRLSLEERIGLAMKHSGVAITITSVTDLLAFGIGATSVLPALGNFCAYASMGIFAVFLQMISFFLAWLVIDQRRIDARRDGVFCCMKKDADWTPNICSQKSIMDTIFKFYSEAIDSMAFKIIILLISCGFFGVSCYGVSQLKAEFDVVNWFPPGTSVVSYMKAKKEHFPSVGIGGKVYLAEIPKIEEKLEEVNMLMTNVGKVPDLANNPITSFLPHFFKFMSAVGVTERKLNEKQFRVLLRNFLCTVGSIFKNDIQYVGGIQLNCQTMMETPEVRMMSFGYRHNSHSGSVLSEFAAYKDVAMALKSVDLGMNESSRLFHHAKQYDNGITMSVVVAELTRNILLAMVCVFVCSLFLIANVTATLIVCCNVSITLMCVAGFMHFWGIVIDTAAAVLLSVALGLAVDYSAHIAHAFMTTAGKSRNERVKKTIVDIGPAVFNGGFSTFLAFAILMFSNSYVFKIFFKIFFLVVVFGLYYGLVCLPVILSLIGPPPLASAENLNSDGKNAVKPFGKNGDLNNVQPAWSTAKEKIAKIKY